MTRLYVLKKTYEMACHNLHCYSANLLMSQPIPGYEEPWTSCKKEVELLQEWIKELETQNEQKNEVLDLDHKVDKENAAIEGQVQEQQETASKVMSECEFNQKFQKFLDDYHEKNKSKIFHDPVILYQLVDKAFLEFQRFFLELANLQNEEKENTADEGQAQEQQYCERSSITFIYELMDNAQVFIKDEILNKIINCKSLKTVEEGEKLLEVIKRVKNSGNKCNGKFSSIEEIAIENMELIRTLGALIN